MPEAKGEAYEPLPLLDDDDLEAADEALADPGHEDDDEQGTAQRIAERLRSIRERAERSGLLVGVEAPEPPADQPGPKREELPEVFVLPAGRLIEKVSALVDWLSEGFEQVFVLDELGDELVRGEVPAGLRSGAVRLAQSWERSQPWLREEGQAAAAPVAGAALADSKVMSVVGVRCASGFFCAAMVGDRMVSAAYGARVREALFLVFG